MSMNLFLIAGIGTRHHAKSKVECSLYQTPTELSYRAIAGSPRNVYFAWLDEWVEADKPNLHPRADKKQRRTIMSSAAWKDYQAFAEQIREHKLKVDRFIKEHPDARWGVS